MTFEQAVKQLALNDPFTKKPISPQALLDTLKDDVVHAVQRPGSWEGCNMLQVLCSHGFFNDYEY
jgi:hypothetical protein